MSELDELYKSLLGDSEKKKDPITVAQILQVVKSYWNYLWSKKWIVVAIGLLGGVIGLVYAFNRKTTYEARYSFTVGGGSSSSGGLGSLTSMLGLGGGNMDAFSGDNVLELIRSRALVEKTLLSPVDYQSDTITFMEYLLICDSVRAKCESDDAPEPKEGSVSICDLTYPLNMDRSGFSRVQDSLLMATASRLLKNNVVASRRDKKLSFMDYTFSYIDEGFAKKFAEAHLNEVTKFYVETKTGLSRKNVASFEAKSDSIKTELNKALSRKAAFADGNRNGSGMYVSSQLQKIEVDIQMLATTYQEMQKNIQVMKLDLVRETPLIQRIDQPHYPLPNDRMRKLKGLVMGGFIGGFLSVLSLIVLYYFQNMKNQIFLPQRKEEVPDLPNE